MTTAPSLALKTRKYSQFILVGAGAEGLVWRASSVGKPPVVAIKEFRSNARAFYQELRARTAVVHPNLPELLDLYDDPESPCMVVEFCSGGSLRDHLEGPEPPNIRQILELGAQMASALAAVHAQAMVHGDVKPENILLARRTGPRCWKLVDFGISSVEAPVRPVLFATRAYAAPEVLLGRRTSRVDVFALGVTLRECLDSCPHDPRVPDEVVRASLQRLTATMTAEEPGARPTAQFVMQELLKLEATLAAIRHVSSDAVEPITFPMEGA